MMKSNFAKQKWIQQTATRVAAVCLAMAYLASCSGGGSNSFGFAGDDSQSSEITKAVEIIDYTPKDNPVVVTHSGVQTFAVTVGSGAGNDLVYTFSLDGTAVQSGPNGFYDMLSSGVGAGDHTFDVHVTNGLTEDTHVFYLTKNTPAVIDSTTPAASGNVVACGGGSLILTVEASDLNGDNLDFVWKYNSAVFPAAFSSIVSNGGQSVATFSPSCVLSGAGTVTVDVSDGYDVVSYTWSVSVMNPIVAQITAFTPSISPVIIPSVGSQLFSISAMGKPPLTYSWLLDGTPIGGANSSFYTVTAGSVTVGPHTLIAKVADSDSDDEQVFNIVRNAPPVLSNALPAESDLKMNYLSTKTFSIEALDANGDNLDYKWTLDGNTHEALLDSPLPSGSQAVLSGSAGLVGSHTVRVRVEDGTEYTDYQWTVEINYFSDACNNLASGQICTVVGRVGLGSGEVPGETPEVVNLHPTHVEPDGTHGVFISDQANHLVWYHNLSGVTVTRLGVAVEAGQIVALVGNGAPGETPNNSKNNLYKLNRPEGLAWDPATESLFIAQYSAHVVSRIDATGAGMRVACLGANSTAAPPGGSAQDHGCYRPVGLALDSDARLLYVSNLHSTAAGNPNNRIRVFNIGDADPANWTGDVLVEGGVPSDGPLGVTAAADRALGLNLDSRGVLYWVDGNSNCRLRVANTTVSAISFYGGASTVNVPAGEVRTLTSGSCANSVGNFGTVSDTNFRPLEVMESAPGVVEGWFVADQSWDRIIFHNNTGAPVTYGGATAAAYSSVNVTATTADYNGNLEGRLTRLNNPAGVSYYAPLDILVFGDYTNSRFRSLDLSVPDGMVATLAGEGFKYGNSGDGGKAPGQIIMREPRDLALDQSSKKLYISDIYNGRIRMLDLVSGWVTTAMGSGRDDVAVAINPVDALGLSFSTGGSGIDLAGGRGLFVHPNGNLIFVDRDNASGVNRSCVVRMSNFLGSTFSFLNTLIPANKISIIAGGDWSGGCAAHGESVQATSTALHLPDGVLYDGANLYVGIWGNHCIAKVDPSGVITTLLGACGTAGYQDGPITDAAVRLRNPSAMALDPVYAEDGNFYFVDADRAQTNTYLRYVNQRASSVMISGISVPANSVGTIVTVGSTQRLKAVAAFDNQFCFAKGEGVYGPHNVTCRNRDDDLQNTTLRAGSSDSSPVASGAPLGQEQEGISSSNATLYEPAGLTFDAEGNLYITERQNHQIRKVKKWW